MLTLPTTILFQKSMHVINMNSIFSRDFQGNKCTLCYHITVINSTCVLGFFFSEKPTDVLSSLEKGENEQDGGFGKIVPVKKVMYYN